MQSRYCPVRPAAMVAGPGFQPLKGRTERPPGASPRPSLRAPGSVCAPGSRRCLTLPGRSRVSYAFTCIMPLAFSCKGDEAGGHFPCWTEGWPGSLKVIPLAKLGPEPRSPASWLSSQLKSAVLFWPRESPSRTDSPSMGNYLVSETGNLSLEDGAEPTTLVPGSLSRGTGACARPWERRYCQKGRALHPPLYCGWQARYQHTPTPNHRGGKVWSDISPLSPSIKTNEHVYQT